MRTILFPTDFSSNAENAFVYALYLAAKRNNKIKVLHVYNEKDLGNSTKVLHEQELQLALNRFIMKGINTRNRRLKEEIATIPIESAIACGDILEQIMIFSNAPAVNLIVMGTVGMHKMPQAGLGSTTANLLSNTTKTVLAIPEVCSYSDIKKIGFAVDYDPDVLLSLYKLLDFVISLNTELHYLHVDAARREIRAEIITLKDIEENNIAPVLNSTLEIKTGNIILDGISQYVKANQIDIIAMVTHNRDLLHHFTQGSLTQQMSLTSEIPILAFHEDVLEPDTKNR